MWLIYEFMRLKSVSSTNSEANLILLGMMPRKFHNQFVFCFFLGDDPVKCKITGRNWRDFVFLI